MQSVVKFWGLSYSKWLIGNHFGFCYNVLHTDDMQYEGAT